MKAAQSMGEGGSTQTSVMPDLDFTGERIVPGKTVDALFREHEERYVFAGQHVAEKDVVDVACGSGVGTSYLRQAGARRVWGVDIDKDAIAFANARYADCEFAQGDATSLSLPNDSVDVVVSFETLEHLSDQRRFLDECRRVIRPGGMLICSTPNTTIYKWQSTNPFHVRELSKKEFSNLLNEYFCEVRMFSQGEQIYPAFVVKRIVSGILDRMGLKNVVRQMLGRRPPGNTYRTQFVDDKAAMQEGIRSHSRNLLIQPMYLIAIAYKSV